MITPSRSTGQQSTEKTSTHAWMESFQKKKICNLKSYADFSINNRKREHYIIQSNSVIAKIILLWILLKGCPTHVWIGHHKKYSSTHTLYLIFFWDYICIWSGPISVLFVFIVEHVKWYLRDKSWKPECVGSFNMEWRILVFYPELEAREKIS